MKNYFDKYLKYKLKYLKLKNHIGAGLNKMMVYEKDKINEKDKIDKIDKIMEYKIDKIDKIDKKDKINKIDNDDTTDLFEKYKPLFEKYKPLFEKYHIYKDNIALIDIDKLRDTLKIIYLLEEHKDFFKNRGIYKDSDIIPSENDLINNMNMIRKFKLLLKYGIFPVIKDNKIIIPAFMETVDKTVVQYAYEIATIELLENDTILIDDKIKIYNQYKDDLSTLRNFLNYKTIQIPKSFYISGLLTFAVYKNEELNKIIYLLGEQHNLQNLCVNDERNTENLIPHYKANDFFFSLLKSGIKNENKLDVFLELYYNPSDKYYKFLRYILKYNSEGYFTDACREIYKNGCKPMHTKNLYKEDMVCLYDRNVRFHHSDLRSHFSNDIFIKYLYTLFFKNVKEFIIKYSDYDKIKLRNLFDSSVFIEKIKKQIRNIKIDYIKAFFDTRLLDFIHFCTYVIDNDLLSYNSKTSLYDFMQNIWNTVFIIFNDIMDMYLMSRIFRSFDGDDNSKNIIIYTGNDHIMNYIKMLEKLNFTKKYHYTNSNDLKEKACLKVDNFNIDYF